MDITQLITLGLCYGRGGLDRGLERGIAALRYPYGDYKGYRGRIIKHAAIVEIEAFAAYNVVAQMEQGLLDSAPVWSDLKTFPWDRFYGKIHCITGGYPCQPFSQAGRQNGVNDPRHLFPFIETGVDAIRPILLFFENVANHLNIGFREVRERIQRLGYTVEADIFSAYQVGAPHLRKRLFILAVADPYCNEQSKRRGDIAEMLGVSKRECKSEYGTSILGRNCEELVNSSGSGSQRRDWIQESNESAKSSEAMDDSQRARLQRYFGNGSERERWKEAVGSIAKTSLWPAGQGVYQHEWEAPRLESSLGFTVDGYDFTTDLLRMDGNAVVEQTAELAFRTLIQKFL